MIFSIESHQDSKSCESLTLLYRLHVSPTNLTDSGICIFKSKPSIERVTDYFLNKKEFQETNGLLLLVNAHNPCVVSCILKSLSFSKSLTDTCNPKYFRNNQCFTRGFLNVFNQLLKSNQMT